MTSYAIGDRIEVDMAQVWKDLAGIARGRIEWVNTPPAGLVHPEPTSYRVWFDKFVFLDIDGQLFKTDTRLTAVGDDNAEHWLYAHQMRKLSPLELIAEAAQ